MLLENRRHEVRLDGHGIFGIWKCNMLNNLKSMYSIYTGKYSSVGTVVQSSSTASTENQPSIQLLQLPLVSLACIAEC